MREAPLGLDVKRLVILCPSWVGDTVMATPVLRAARQALPQARIIAAARPGLDQLLAGSPWIDDVFSAETKGVVGALRTTRWIRKLRPDAVLVLPNSFRSALIARGCGAPVRIGYDREARGRLLTARLPAPPARVEPVSTLEHYLALGRFALGVDRIDPRMELIVTDAEQSAARRLLERVDRPFVVLNPGANKPSKRWPADRFAAVADALADRRQLGVLVSGSPSETNVVRAVVEAATAPVVDLVQLGVTLGSLKAVLHQARLLITNDTGPRHIAAALGTPVVGLFGPTDHRWTDIDCPHERIVVAEPFLPQALVADEHPQRCRIEKITVGDVVSTCEELLAASSAPVDASPPAAGASIPSVAPECG